MSTQDLSRQVLWAAMVLIAVSGAAALTPLHAQQAQSSPTASAPSATLRGPRLSSQLQRYEPGLALSAGAASSSSAAAESHTIVISTLALVLIIVIIVLLI